MHLTKYAKNIAIVGIILSCLSLISSLFAWNFFPVSIAILLAFILVLIGLNKTEAEYLLAANILLIISILIYGLFIIGSIYIATTVPQYIIEDFHQKQIYKNWGLAKKDLRNAYFILAFILLIVIAFLIFAFIIIQKTRKYFLSNPIRQNSLSPESCNPRRPSHHFGYFSNLPMYSVEDKYSTQEMKKVPSNNNNNEENYDAFYCHSIQV